MEEDIDILEDFLEYNGFLENSVTKEDIRELQVYMSKNEYKALENLIARYKELEKENLKIRDWKYVIDSYEDLDRLKELDVIKIKGKEYLAKSKVKEKIKELEEQLKYNLFKNYEIYTVAENKLLHKIEVLQELLED